MAFSQFTFREQLARFWPFLILLFLAIFYLIYKDLSLSRMLFFSDTRKLQARIDSPSAKKPLPYPVMVALVHYATTAVKPQQTSEEIMITTKILSQRAPCNFLVFGLGHDSTLWQTLNHGGNTVFLEEDSNWIAKMKSANPDLKAIAVNYTTMLSEAAELLAHARKESEICSPAIELQRSECKLAIKGLPEEIYKETWDVVMIDAPRGYFEKAPGRMSAIFSAAVMAKGREKKESTHILVHDVDRTVEKGYSLEFLCSENLIEGAGRLWHFQLYGDGVPRSSHFCPL